MIPSRYRGIPSSEAISYSSINVFLITIHNTHMHLFAGLYVAVETLNKVSNLNSSHVPSNYVVIASLCVCVCADKGANCVIV